jgi:hypothetical protein
LQTGGSALGETSTRSSPVSTARFSASRRDITPSMWPFSSIKRTLDALICSLTRGPSVLGVASKGGLAIRVLLYKSLQTPPVVALRKTEPPVRMAAGKRNMPQAGARASLFSLWMASSSASTSWASPPSRRKATLPASASRLPTTRSTGTFAKECSRTL